MLRILTMNVNQYSTRHGPWSERRRLFTRIIREAQPHVVALQAVRMAPHVGGGRDQAAQIADDLGHGWHTTYQIASRLDDGSVEGVAFLARVPLAGFDVLELSRRKEREDPFHRIAVRGEVLTAEGRVQIIQTHLSWVREQLDDNVDELVPFVDSFPAPKMLVGDMNGTPDSAAMRRVREAGWTDAWARLHPTEPGFTYEAGRLAKRIDYVWLSDELTGRLREVTVVGEVEPGETARPSDHLGVLATFDIHV